MNRNRKKQYLVYILFVLSYIAVMCLVILLLSGESIKYRIILEYEAERTSALLTESILRDGIPEDFRLPDTVIGFGIYNDDGERILTMGKAPLYLDPKIIRGMDHRFTYGGSQQSFVIIRRIGHPFMQQRMRRQMNQFSDPPAPDWMDDRQQMMPPDPVPGPKILFLEFNALRYRNRIFSNLTIGLVIGVVLFAVMIGLIFLYRKNSEYREKLVSQEHLARLGEMARVLAHEIKNPLGAIKIQTGYLKKILPDANRPDLLIIDEEIDRLSILTNRISDFMRDPAGTPEKTGLVLFITSLLKRFDSLITFIIVAPDGTSESVPGNIHTIDGVQTGNSGADGTDFPGFDDTIYFDRDRLRSVIENVINNAIQSSEGDDREKKMPELVLKYDRKHLVLSVLDRGKGIPAPDREKVFDPFYTTRAKGSGIGLSITRRFLQAQGGSIVLLPREGGGTEARLYFRRSLEESKNTHR